MAGGPERSARAAPPEGRQAPGAGSGRPSWRRRWNWGVPGLLLPLALVLNPDEARHRQTLREAIDANHPVTAGFDVQERADPPMSYHSAGVLSWTRHDRALTTVGAFGQVAAVGRKGRSAASLRD